MTGLALQRTLNRTAFLARNAGVQNNGAGRDFTVAGAIQQQLTAVELVHLGKRWLRGVRPGPEPAIYDSTQLGQLRASRILNFPGAVE